MLPFFLDISHIRILLALSMLAIASVSDIKKREIHDSLWIAFGSVAVLLLFFEPNIFNALRSVGLSLLIAPLAIFAWRMGFFGGADAFALIVLAALAPGASLSVGLVMPFTTLTNAAILSAASLLVNVAHNLFAISRHQNIFEGFEETRLRKAIAIFLGYRASNPRYSFSMEKIEGNKKKLDLSLHNADHDNFCTASNIWVTPGIPYILYIAGGFVIQLFFGDILLTSIGSFLIRS